MILNLMMKMYILWTPEMVCKVNERQISIHVLMVLQFSKHWCALYYPRRVAATSYCQNIWTNARASIYIQYCAKVIKTPVDEIRRNSLLFDEFLTETKLWRHFREFSRHVLFWTARTCGDIFLDGVNATRNFEAKIRSVRRIFGVIIRCNSSFFQKDLVEFVVWYCSM